MVVSHFSLLGHRVRPPPYKIDVCSRRLSLGNWIACPHFTFC